MSERGESAAGWARPLVILLTTLGLIAAFGYLLWHGIDLVVHGPGSRRGLGVGLLLLTAIGAWATWAILRDGVQLQRIAAAARAEGCDLDVSELPHRPSGRLETGAADELFDEVSAEYQRSPEDWRSNYRLARAYDFAGDRSRAREVMRRTRELYAAERGRTP